MLVPAGRPDAVLRALQPLLAPWREPVSTL